MGKKNGSVLVGHLGAAHISVSIALIKPLDIRTMLPLPIKKEVVEKIVVPTKNEDQEKQDLMFGDGFVYIL